MSSLPFDGTRASKVNRNKLIRLRVRRLSVFCDWENAVETLYRCCIMTQFLRSRAHENESRRRPWSLTGLELLTIRDPHILQYSNATMNTLTYTTTCTCVVISFQRVTWTLFACYNNSFSSAFLPLESPRSRNLFSFKVLPSSDLMLDRSFSVRSRVGHNRSVFRCVCLR